MARRMPQASSSLKALTITRPRQGRTRHMLGRERPPLYAPCLDRSERSSPLLHPPSKQDLPASVPALVGADQHHLSGLGLPTTLPEGSENPAGRLLSPSSRVPSLSPTTRREFEVWWRLRRTKGVSSRHLSVADRVDLTVAPPFRTSFSLSGTVGLSVLRWALRSGHGEGSYVKQ